MERSKLKPEHESLLAQIAYLAYLWFYGISDDKPKPADVHLNNDVNDWNLDAIRSEVAKRIANLGVSNARAERVQSYLSDFDNEWNKEALEITKAGNFDVRHSRHK